LAEHRRKTEAALSDARAEFDVLVERRSFTAEWRVPENELPEAMMLHARHASLAILGPPARQRSATTMLGLAESMILASGRPSLLLPEAWPADRIGRRVVVGWNGSREATRAVADAMPFLAAADAVHLVVVPDARTGSLLGEEPGADMATHLARQGVPVVVEQCPGHDAGEVLLQACRKVDADLVVMGAMGRPLIGEIVFGGATRTVLASAKLPVLLSS
jgi:nucleotide-binding universal stress UspA family protein